MSAVYALLGQVLHAALMLAAAPLLAGLLAWLRARLLGRRGASPLQPWRDLQRLAHKQPVLAENASWLFEAAPAISFAATLVAAVLVPSFALDMTTAPLADLLVIAALLALARCVLALAGMDIGTAIGGLGASRAMTFAAFAEPGLLLVIFTFALLAGSTNVPTIAQALREGSAGLRLSLGLALLAMLAVALAANFRIPVDDRQTCLELTMVHEAMAREYSGRHLALIEWAAALRLLLWLTLIATLFLPLGIAAPGASPLFWPLGLLAWAAKISLLGGGLVLFETLTARMRLFRVPEFLVAALLLGLLAVLFLIFSQGFA
jgi:formate hydrogenlyase subunit 4